MTERSRKTTRRYFRRIETPRPWWPWGAAPLAGLGVLFLFGALFIAPRIEADVRDEVTRRVDGAGFELSGVTGDGQGITIDAPVRPRQVLFVEALAASTRCDTWAGRLTCPSSIDVRQIDLPSAAVSRPHRRVVEKTAEAIAGGDGRSGAVGSEALPGEFSVRPLQDTRQCNQQFADILAGATIRFQTGSAIIDAGNEALLDSLAEVAGSCPGALTIEGHTDSQGDADSNAALSLARATAVRDALASRGIDLNRVQAVGLGESQPIAGNNTIEGRARNRRIAISIDDTK